MLLVSLSRISRLCGMQGSLEAISSPTAGVGASGTDRSLAFVAGALIGVFQLVGRTQVGQLIGAGDDSALGELGCGSCPRYRFGCWPLRL